MHLYDCLFLCVNANAFFAFDFLFRIWFVAFIKVTLWFCFWKCFIAMYSLFFVLFLWICTFCIFIKHEYSICFESYFCFFVFFVCHGHSIFLFYFEFVYTCQHCLLFFWRCLFVWIFNISPFLHCLCLCSLRFVLFFWLDSCFGYALLNYFVIGW